MLLRLEIAYMNIDATRRAGELQRKEERPQSSEVNPNTHRGLCQETCLNYFTKSRRVDMSYLKERGKIYISHPMNTCRVLDKEEPLRSLLLEINTSD